MMSAVCLETLWYWPSTVQLYIFMNFFSFCILFNPDGQNFHNANNFGVRNTIEILSGHYTSNAVDSGNPLYSQQSDDLGSL